MSEHGEHERGFTLIEVMLTVILLSIVMGALATAAIVFLRNINETQARLYVSNSRSLTSRYLVGDIQAAAVYDSHFPPRPWDGVPKGTGTVVVPASGTLPVDAVEVPPPVTTCTATPQPVLTTYHYDVYPGDDPDVPNKDQPTMVQYSVVAPAPGDDCQLVRTKSAVAKSGASYDWAVVEQNTVAHDLLVDGTPMVAVTDRGNRRWQVHVNLRPKSSEDVNYSFDLWARRRVESIVP